MSLASIRAVLESRLAAMTPALATAYENAQFTPAQGTPYQRVNLLPGTPENPTLGDGYYREIGILQVSLYFPLNAGPAAAQARAMAIRNHFPRGLTVTAGATTVTVRRTPAIGPGMVDADRYMLPVSIDWYSHIFP